MARFEAKKFYTYRSPNHYLDRQALVFNLSIAPDVKPVADYRDEVVSKFPDLDKDFPDTIAELFARCLIQVLKMDINLFVERYSVGRDGEEHVIAVEYLDDRVAENCAHFVANWFDALTLRDRFDFDNKFLKLQDDFDRTLFGGPTLYSLIEAGLKREIPILYLYEENQFMWGYGRKQARGRSTTFHVDSIKDTEFTEFKDMCKEFLLMCGFPTPLGRNCFEADEAVDEAHEQGFPVVVKPVAGHKGQGVTTNIDSDAGVREAFKRITDMAKTEGVNFDGAIVEKQVFGTDHRLLAVGGKFAAALERVAAYVDGNGRDTIEKLIEIDNATEARLDNARSPLCKIKIDDDLEAFLKLQDLSLRSVPKEGERVTLRRVANISAGGVSINVTDRIHPKNIKLVEDIAKYFEVVCLGIDVLAEDISKPWDESDFGIIEINAGPGVFMHLAPAIGESIDVPGKVMSHLFPYPKAERVPIIAANCISIETVRGIYEALKTKKSTVELGAITDEGVSFNGQLFHKNKSHYKNGIILLRNPKLDFAVMQHTKEDLYDYGTIAQGADLVLLDRPSEVEEETLTRDLLPEGYLLRIDGDTLTVTRGAETITTAALPEHERQATAEEKDGRRRAAVAAQSDREAALIEVIAPLAGELLHKYDGPTS